MTQPIDTTFEMTFSRKKIKSIEVEGEITTLGEYREDIDSRAYHGVSITDKDGEQLFFTLLTIPKSLCDQIRISEPVHLKIIRLKNNAHLVGGVYSLRSNKDKEWYYDSVNSPQLIKSFIEMSYKRAAGGIHASFIFSIFMFVILWSVIGFPFKEGLFSGITAGALTLTFVLWPYVVAPKRSGFLQYIANFKERGIKDIRSNANSNKY
jgi:hypothetical protein